MSGSSGVVGVLLGGVCCWVFGCFRVSVLSFFSSPRWVWGSVCGSAGVWVFDVFFFFVFFLWVVFVFVSLLPVLGLLLVGPLFFSLLRRG